MQGAEDTNGKHKAKQNFVPASKNSWPFGKSRYMER